MGALANRLRSASTSLAGEVITLTVAAQKVSVYRQDAAFVLGRVLSDAVRVFWSAGKMPVGLQLDKGDISRLTDDLRTERPYITRQQLVTQLGMKIGTVGLWVAVGLITPLHSEGAAVCFACDAAAQFRQDYMFSDEAAALLSVRKLTVQKWALSGRLKPTSGPGVDAGQRYVFRRVEVGLTSLV